MGASRLGRDAKGAATSGTPFHMDVFFPKKRFINPLSNFRMARVRRGIFVYTMRNSKAEKLRAANA